MIKRRRRKRILICTFVALTSGILSSYVGGQISLKVHSQKCQTQPWGLQTVCNAWVAPGAIWQGSTTGLWLGTLLGALVSGLATRDRMIASTNVDVAGQKLTEAVSLCADELELTPEQREVLRSFLVLLILELSSSNDIDVEADTLSLEQLQRLVAIAKQQSLNEPNLVSEICQQKSRSNRAT